MEWPLLVPGRLTPYRGSFRDRAAELGNVLLKNGFTVSITDKEAREGAVNGDFSPEHKRWITKKQKGLFFFIPLSSSIPREVVLNLKKIPTAAYHSGGIFLEPSHYEELEDFAEMYGFRFDREAGELPTRLSGIPSAGSSCIACRSPALRRNQ